MTALLDAPAASDRPGSAGAPSPRTSRRPAAGPLARVLLALATAGLLAVLTAALLVGGGAPGPATAGLPDAGPVVGWGQPVVALLVRLLAVLVTGSLLVAAVLHPAPGGRLPEPSRTALGTAAAAAAAWALAEVVGLLLLTGSLLGRGVTELVPADVLAVVLALPAGRTAPVVVLLLLLVAAGAWLSSRGSAPGLLRARLLLLLALVAVVLPVVTTGHPAAAADHVATVVALAVHVVAASLWVGGLLGLLLHVRGPEPDRAVAVERLSRLALGCVVAVTATGVAGALLLADVTPATVLGTGWGALLLVKTAAVVGLVALGWWHRRRTLPALRVGRPGAFVRLAVVETGLMAATLAVAVALAAAPPPEPATPQAAVPAVLPAAGPASGEDVAVGGDDAVVAQPAPVGDPAPAEDMSGHDHGELSVGVLVDDQRLHVGSPVRAGAPVTVYNSGAEEVVLRAADGAFDTVVPSRTFLTFPAPTEPGAYPFGDPDDPRYADVLQVLPPR